MTTVTGSLSPINMGDPIWLDAFLFSDTISSPRTSTQFTTVNSDMGGRWFVQGSGFTYSGGVPQTGTVTSITFSINNIPQITITGMSLSVPLFFQFAQNFDTNGLNEHVFAGADTISGSQAFDNLFGYGGNDTITGGPGGDALNGGAGDDTLTAGNDFDFLNGDSGVDTLFGNAGNDVMDGGDDNDTLHGGAGADEMTGGAGNDTLNGGDDGDRIDAGSGVDAIDGGAADDTLTLNRSSSVLSYTMALNDWATAEGVTLADGTTIKNVERFHITTGSGDDVFSVSWPLSLIGLNVNSIDGGGGFDQLTADFSAATGPISSILTWTSIEQITLLAGSDNDTINGAIGNDNISGGGGNDTLGGGDGADMLNGGDGADTLDGGAGIDTLDGGDGADILIRGLGDTLLGGAGDDVFVGAAAATMDGGDGADSIGLDLSASSANQTISLLNMHTNAGVTLVDGSVVRNVERFDVDTGSGNDTLSVSTGLQGSSRFDSGTGTDRLIGDFTATTTAITMNSGAVIVNSAFEINFDTQDQLYIYGGSGNDVLIGWTGNDVLYGGDGADFIASGGGDDFVRGGAGADTLQAGDGFDILDYSQSNAAIQLDLYNNNNHGGHAEGDMIYSFDRYNGSIYNDTFIGSNDHEIFVGGAGNDHFSGNGGLDTLRGGLGDDTYEITDDDIIVEEVGEGIDTVVSLFSYTLQANVENLIMTFLHAHVAVDGWGNSVNNVITGNNIANNLYGYGGDDTLDGGAGADNLTGGAGNDTYIVDTIGDTITELGGEGIDTVVSSIDWTLGAQLENLTLTGASVIHATGNFLNNTLVGNSAFNVLNGAGGADSMFGGAGDDTYVVNDVGDTVTELAGGGHDSVQSSVSFTLGAYVEDLGLTGAAAANGSGNELANHIAGNSAANQLFGFAGDDTLNGLGGADTMTGGLGNDHYVVDNLGDVIVETGGGGIDHVESSVTITLSAQVESVVLTGGGATNATGNGLNNILVGNSGWNVLNGGFGADSMNAGLGNDTYFVDNVGDTVTELLNEGVDLVNATVSFTLGDNVESLSFGGSADVNGTGNALNNKIIGNSGANTILGGDGFDILFGNAGNDILDGGLSQDQMYGGLGDDIYYVSQTNDTAFENAPDEGVDTVYSAAANYTISAGVENITLLEAAGAGSKAIGNALDNFVIGNSFDNILFGKDGNDHIGGGLGNDTMYGGAGDDAYHIDDAGDIAFESAGQGHDVVLAHISYTLRANIEDLVLSFEGGSTNGAGNTLANVIHGNAYSNTLDGAAGDDVLIGFGGDDTLIGGAGDDTFVFTLNGGHDIVTGFVAGGAEDSLDLSHYDGSGVTWNVTQLGADTLFSFSNGDFITLLNVDNTQLVQDDAYHYS